MKLEAGKTYLTRGRGGANVQTSYTLSDGHKEFRGACGGVTNLQWTRDGLAINASNAYDIVAKCDEPPTERLTAVDKIREALATQPAFRNKPLAGLRPRRIANGDRILEICAAIRRFTRAGRDVPPQWIDELRDLTADVQLAPSEGQQ